MEINLEVVAISPRGTAHVESGWQPLDVDNDGVIDGEELSLKLTIGPTEKTTMLPVFVKVSFREEGVC